MADKGKSKTGKYFHCNEDVLDRFGAWSDKRPWLKQGGLVSALLNYAMSLSREELMALLDQFAAGTAEALEAPVGGRPVNEEKLRKALRPPPKAVRRKKAGGESTG